MNIEEVYEKLNKSTLIKIYRNYMKENKQYSKNRKKEGPLVRPEINGETFSWAEFRRLPRDAILVYVFTKGCNLEYMSQLDASFFTETREWHPNYGESLWATSNGNSEEE
jgi:hypothetical protein